MITKNKIKNIIHEEINGYPDLYSTKYILNEDAFFSGTPSLGLALYGHKGLNEGLISDAQLLNQYFDHRWTLDEATCDRAELLIEELKTSIYLLREGWLGDLGSSIGNLAKSAGEKIADGGKYLADKASKAAGNLKDGITWLASKGSDMVLKMLAKIPYAEEIIAWIKEAPAKLADMAKNVKDSMTEWMKNAKDNAMKFVLNLISKDPEVKKHVLEEFGIEESEFKALIGESNQLGIETLTDLKWWIAIDNPNSILFEQQGSIEKVKKGDKVPFTGTMVSPEAAEKIAGGDSESIEALSSEQTAGQDLKKTIVTIIKQTAKEPQEALKTLLGSGKKILSQFMDVVSSIVEKNPEKYMKMMADSPLIKVFRTGYGYSAGIIATMLASKSDKIDALKKMLTKMKAGWDVGTGDMGQEAVDFMLKPSAKGKGIRISRILKNVIDGGSALQQMAKAYIGDPAAIKEMTKRVFNIVYAQIKQLISKNPDDIISQVPGGEEFEEQEKADFLTSLDGAVAGMFGAEAA